MQFFFFFWYLRVNKTLIKSKPNHNLIFNNLKYKLILKYTTCSDTLVSIYRKKIKLLDS